MLPSVRARLAKHNEEQDRSLEKVGFGMHRNKSWCEVPQKYLEQYAQLPKEEKILRIEQEIQRRKRLRLWKEK